MNGDDRDFLDLGVCERQEVLAHGFEVYLRGYRQGERLLNTRGTPLEGVLGLATTADDFVARMRPTRDIQRFLLGLEDVLLRAERQVLGANRLADAERDERRRLRTGIITEPSLALRQKTDAAMSAAETAVNDLLHHLSSGPAPLHVECPDL